jgi:aspartyl aminopeptidase
MEAKRAKTSGITVEGRQFGNVSSDIAPSLSLPASHQFQEFIDFINESCTPFHAIEEAKRLFLAAGFESISEADNWNLIQGGKYFFTRNSTSIIAFTVGANYSPGNGFTVVGAHSDSPCFRIKPVACSVKADALVLNTQPYGGGLWHTWFDRDLGIAGRVIIRNADGNFESRLVKINRAVARIPNLAIHLTSGPLSLPRPRPSPLTFLPSSFSSGDERTSFSPNLHEHCKAILSMDPSNVRAQPLANGFNSCLAHLIAEEIGLSDPEDLVDLDLQLIDLQPSCVGGASDELIFSGRLDNLCSSYQCIRSLISASQEATELPMTSLCHNNVQIVMIFDHEEVGSSSAQGAGSSMFMDTLRRIEANFSLDSPSTSTSNSSISLMQALRKSYVVSIDMAHAHHPNYPGKHDATMAPKINQGLVIKHNCNQRYATNSLSAVMFREFAKISNLAIQEFTVRADMACGRYECGLILSSSSPPPPPPFWPSQLNRFPQYHWSDHLNLEWNLNG